MSVRTAAHPILVAIVGGSGSGKSWLAERLSARLAPRAARLSLDDFYRDQSHLAPARRARINFDHPHSIDWPTFEKALGQLLANRAAFIPRYDFATHTRLPKSVRLRPKRIILADGLWLLRRPSLRRVFTFSIFLECPAAVRLRRRLVRDLQSRGRTAGSIRQQFRMMVQPMHQRFVAPQAQYAEIIMKTVPTARQVEELAGRICELTGEQQRVRGQRGNDKGQRQRSTTKAEDKG